MIASRKPLSLLLVVGWLLWPARGDSRLAFSASDPSFTGATVEAFDPNPAPGATHFSLTLTGVTFTFDTASGTPIVSCGNPADCLVEARNPSGIEITISPPVSSIGFLYQGAECFGQIEFTGAGGSESFEFNFGQFNIFVGAAEIGDISKVTLNDWCFASWWDDMRFVPSTGTPPPTLVADLALEKTAPAVASQLATPTVTNTLTVFNDGPDTATMTQIIDFLPRGATFLGSAPAAVLDALGAVATMTLGDLPSGASAIALMDLTLLPFDASFPGRFGCDDILLNIALATSSSIEPNSPDNLALATTFFDNTSRHGMPEICGNGIDDNCNGKTDCNDPVCNCYPQLSGGGGVQCSGGIQIVPGVGVVTNGICSPPTVSASSHRCCVPRGTCGDVCVDIACCDPSRFSDPSQANQEYIRDHCDLGVPGCAPQDPNFKESSPGVNIAGYGHTEAGRTMTYTLHYENIGNADAHDVLVLDTLDLDLDDSSLVVNNGGTYDPATRTLQWIDPVVPPATPRSVSFSVAVRGDAAEGTVVRNVGTIVFPDAVPPSRIDTNFVEHTILSPDNPAVPAMRVLGCTETAPGSGQWKVDLVNEGYGYAYNVTASILQPPPSAQVTDGTASFQHPDDSDPSILRTVLPLATTTSADTVAFSSSAGAQCAALNWCIHYENLQGDVLQQGTCTRCGDGHLDSGEQCDDGNNDDGDGCSATCAIENQPPDCAAAAPSITRLWPPNHRLEPFGVVGVTDPDGDAVTVTIGSIRQDEPVDGTGDGDTAPDGFGAGSNAAQLRSERSGGGNGRVYHIAFTAADGAGGDCDGEVTVCVPHDGKPGRVCVDEGPLFDSSAQP